MTPLGLGQEKPLLLDRTQEELLSEAGLGGGVREAERERDREREKAREEEELERKGVKVGE